MATARTISEWIVKAMRASPDSENISHISDPAPGGGVIRGGDLEHGPLTVTIVDDWGVQTTIQFRSREIRDRHAREVD